MPLRLSAIHAASSLAEDLCSILEHENPEPDDVEDDEQRAEFAPDMTSSQAAAALGWAPDLAPFVAAHSLPLGPRPSPAIDEACRRLSEQARIFLTQLAEAGQADDMLLLLRGGWGRVAHGLPDGSLSQRAASLAHAISGAGPRARSLLLDMADAGLPLFGSAPSLTHPFRAPLEEGDLPLARSLLARLSTDVPDLAARRAIMGDASDEGHGMPDALATLIAEDPALWAAARGPASRGGAMCCALSAGSLRLARAMAEAAPEEALASAAGSAGPLSGSGSNLGRTLMLAADPEEALDLLLRLGADPKALDADGSGPLHALPFNPNHGAARRAARRLVALGADPRLPDAEGATPIGVSLTQWPWEDCVDLFSATPRDALSSRARHRGQDKPAILHAIDASRQFEHCVDAPLAARAAARSDERLARLWAACLQEPGAPSLWLLDRALESAASQGMPKTFEALARKLIAEGDFLRPTHLGASLDRPSSSADQEQGMRDCFSIAVALGLDLAAPLRPNDPRQASDTLMSVALGNIGPLDTPWTKARPGIYDDHIRRARHLFEIGADPSCPSPDGSRIWDRPCWTQWPDSTKAMVREWGAERERLALAEAALESKRRPAKRKPAL